MVLAPSIPSKPPTGPARSKILNASILPRSAHGSSTGGWQESPSRLDTTREAARYFQMRTSYPVGCRTAGFSRPSSGTAKFSSRKDFWPGGACVQTLVGVN